MESGEVRREEQEKKDQAENEKGKGEGDWQLVKRRRQKVYRRNMGRLDIACNGNRLQSGTISFYFSYFPVTHGAKEMLRAFALYGKAVEVVIPPKTNKWGKRFGFVRFSDVKDPRLFAVKLDNIIFGADKIHVNLPRFERDLNNKQEGSERVRREQGAREKQSVGEKQGVK